MNRIKNPVSVLFLVTSLTLFSQEKSPCGNVHKKAEPKAFLNCFDQIMYDEEINTYVLAKDGFTLFDGTCQSYNRSGFVIDELTCKKGKRDGVDNSYFSSGCIQSTQSYIIGIKNGPQKVFFDTTGQLRREENFLNGKLNGRVCEFSRYGDTLVYLNYSNDIPDGEQREYYPDGKIAKVTRYKKGLLEGLHLNFGQNGKLTSSLAYKEGKNNGKWVYYADNGKEIGIQNWLMGQKNGDFITQNDEGIILLKGTFKKDVPIGEHIENNEKGKLIHQTLYDKKGIRQYEMKIDEYGDKKVIYDINNTKTETGIQNEDDNPENIGKKEQKQRDKKRKKERRAKDKE
ncbi:MAG: toxin-antitoxin system YwqK family antitoxin [Flavobacteriia bacterium]|nr:toxin-antitoxin system YwqK family antitoxin [Flavobacteriia bacterium]